MKSTRNSSVELLRILSMLTIVGVHYLGNNSLNELSNSFTVEGEFFIIIKTLLNYGVNIFVIISGYYFSDKTECSVRKVVKLLFDVSFYGFCMYLISILVGVNSFSISGLGKSVFPLFAGYRWFIKAYIVMYLLSPFVAKLLCHISQKAHLSLIVVSGLFLSLWPYFLPSPPIDDYGFSFVNFILLFIIAGYLRKYINIIKAGYCVLLFLGCTAVTVSLQTLKCAGITGFGIGSIASYSLAHNSPFNILACCCVFLLFVKRSYYSKVINFFAASAFAVYLIHGDFNMMGFIFNNIFKSDQFQNGTIWIPHMFVTCVLIYVICVAIDFLKIHSVDILINKMFDKIRIINYRIKS